MKKKANLPKINTKPKVPKFDPKTFNRMMREVRKGGR
jgi:hypothetical protein